MCVVDEWNKKMVGVFSVWIPSERGVACSRADVVSYIERWKAVATGYKLVIRQNNGVMSQIQVSNGAMTFGFVSGPGFVTEDDAAYGHSKVSKVRHSERDLPHRGGEGRFTLWGV